MLWLFFAVSNKHLGMTRQISSLEVLLLRLHFTLILPHKYTDDKLGSGTCGAWEQMNLLSSQTLGSVS